MTEPRRIYFNDVQRRIQLLGARTTVCVAGRRTGKTDSVASPFLLRNFQRMPGSGNGIVAPTFKHALTNTIPGMLSAWNRWGYREGIHYVVGKNPPKHFLQPIIPPKQNAHIIRYANGAFAYILSQDVAFSANSLTLSSLLVDEARFCSYDKLKNETIPALGGIRSYFGHKSCWNSMMVLSDMPQSQKGSWFLKYREDMDPELIATIEAIICELWKLEQRLRDFKAKGIRPPEYLRNYRRRLDRDLNRLRSQAVYYCEYSSIENLQLLGEDYIRHMKRDLTPKTFQTSILCRRLGIAKDGFYSSMRESHKYDADNVGFLEEMFYQHEWADNPKSLKDGLDSRSDSDLDPDASICVGLDYNANINCLVAGQPDPLNSRLNVLKSFFVKYERKLPELIDDFCRYYRFHRRKHVVFYHDSTALGSNYAVSDVDFRRVIIERFRRNGWEVDPVYLGAPMKHNEKYLLINQGFAGHNRLTPYLNRQNNEDLIFAIQAAEVERGRNGFRKNKSGEKVPESEESPLERRTDITDAFDTLYIGCERFPRVSASAVIFSGGVM